MFCGTLSRRRCWRTNTGLIFIMPSAHKKKTAAVAGGRQFSVSLFIILAAHGEAHGRAPQAGLRLVHAVDGLVSPLGRHGGKRLRVGVVGRGVYGQEHKALAIATVHPDFATAQIEAETLPAPLDHHMAAHQQDVDEGHQHGQIRPDHHAAHNAQFDGGGVVAFAAVLHQLDAGHDAGEGARKLRSDAGRQRGGGVGVEHHDVVAGAGLRSEGGLATAR